MLIYYDRVTLSLKIISLIISATFIQCDGWLILFPYYKNFTRGTISLILHFKLWITKQKFRAARFEIFVSYTWVLN